MKTAMKKVFSMMLALLLLVSVFPMTAFAAEEATCEKCGQYESSCICCPKCGEYYCVCCNKCNEPVCICCPQCGQYDCICCPKCGQYECVCCKACNTAYGHTDTCYLRLCLQCELEKEDCICCDICDGTIFDHERHCPKFTGKNGRPNKPSKGELTLTLDYNYDGNTKDVKVDKGETVGAALRSVRKPSRKGYTFAGWYWDTALTTAVKSSDTITESDTIYAKWTESDGKDKYDKYDKYDKDHWKPGHGRHEVMLKIYVNGKTESAAKIVDMHDYSRDGKIAMDEVIEVVKKYYVGPNGGLTYKGLFEIESWNQYVREEITSGEKAIKIHDNADTVVYIMVTNAAVYSTSSATADTTNPKTGDMIFMPAMILGLSASALAVMFFLNKKRAV